MRTRRVDTACVRVRREVNGLMESLAERVVTEPTDRLAFAEHALALIVDDIAAVRLHIAGQLQLRDALAALDPDGITLKHAESGGQKRVEAYVDGQYVGAHLCGTECHELYPEHAAHAARYIAFQSIIKKGATTA